MIPNFAVLTSRIGSFFSSFMNLVPACISDFSLTDAIDIFVLTFVLFFLLRFVRGRKGGVLLIGIFILLILTAVAHFFGLDATYYTFSLIFDVGVIAIIILFQPEIRDALERVGSGSINGIMSLGDQKKKQQQYYSVINHVTTAINDLAGSKTGALIVISRTTKLDDIIQTGVKMNSEISSFLLRNLFFNKAPLHDGAVVIDDGKIAAAGCLLPNTRRHDIDSDLGTRHRAAIGMSEISDAIIVVVSEETGTISVAHDCTLTRNYTSDGLRKFLIQKLINSGGDHLEDKM